METWLVADREKTRKTQEFLPKLIFESPAYDTFVKNNPLVIEESNYESSGKS